MKNLIRTTLCSTALILFSTAQPIHASAVVVSSSAPLIVIVDDGAYTAGTKAMDEHRWQDAVLAFEKVINEKGARVDSALYWKAYSLNKLGKASLAVATCAKLHAQYAGSAWNKDCDAMSMNTQVDMKVMADQMKINADQMKINADQMKVQLAPFSVYTYGEDNKVVRGSDEDLKMLALNSLLNRDPTAAIPLLRGILSGNQSINVKKHALFVLAQSKSPEAENILHDAALGKLDPQLQGEAIRTMAVFQGKRANDTLAEVYRTTTDPKIKKSIISAMFITQDASRMVEMARNEKDLELKRTIVSQLALMNDKAATDYMMELLK